MHSNKNQTSALPIIFQAAIVFSVLISSADSIFAEDPNAPVYLKDYLQEAAAKNAGLQSAYEQWRSAMLAVRPAGTPEDPKLEYDYFIRDTSMGDRHRLRIMQMLPWFGTLEARTDAASAAAKAAGQRYQAEYLDLVRRVKQSFYEYSYLANAVRIAQANLDLLRSFEQVAQSRYRVAAAAQADVIRAQIELAEMEDALVSVEQMRRPASAELCAILNRPTDVLLPWPVCGQTSLIRPDVGKISQQLAQSNPELKAIRFDAVSARHEADLADKRFYPNIDLGVEWMFLNRDQSGMSGNDHDPVALMFSINLPIWQDSYRDKVGQARSQVVRIRRQEQQKTNDLSAEAARTIYDLEDSWRKTVLYSSILIPKARQMVQVSEDAYRSGSLDFLRLLDAQRKQLMYELAYERSLTTHLQQQARLEQLLGGKIPDTNQP